MDSPILFADDLPDSTLHDRVARGDLARLARGIYTNEVGADPTEVVRRTWREIVGRRFPGAVVTDRSAIWAQPHDGYLFIASSRDGRLSLPGLEIVSRKGPAAVEGDMALGAGVHLASRPRALLDNTRPTSSSAGTGSSSKRATTNTPASSRPSPIRPATPYSSPPTS